MITDRQINALRSEAAIAGDSLQIAICDLALDPDVARLVDPDERTTLVIMTQDDAREECERVIAAAS